jgi:hypothetical protein
MTIAKGQVGGVTAVVLSGEIDRAAIPDLRLVLCGLRGASPILFDCTRAVFVDSAFVAALYDAIEDMPHDGWIGAYNAYPNILRVFRLAGLLCQPRFRVLRDLEEISSVRTGQQQVQTPSGRPAAGTPPHHLRGRRVERGRRHEGGRV